MEFRKGVLTLTLPPLLILVVTSVIDSCRYCRGLNCRPDQEESVPLNRGAVRLGQANTKVMSLTIRKLEALSDHPINFSGNGCAYLLYVLLIMLTVLGSYWIHITARIQE